MDPESSRLAIAADLAEMIAASRFADAHVVATQTQGAERLAEALSNSETYLAEFAAALGDDNA